MLEKIFGELALQPEKVPNGLVVLMGVGVVFIGLIAIVIICKIMSAIMAPKAEASEEKVVTAPVVQNTAVIENRQEIIAAVSAVIAEELGTEVEALKIHSFKKI